MAESNVYRRLKQTVVSNDELANSVDNQIITRFGIFPSFVYQKFWTKGVLLICAFIIVYFSSSVEKEIIFASQKDVYEMHKIDIPCSESYKSEVEKFKDCSPQICGRLVSDTLVSKTEVDTLINIAKSGIALGGSEGGASILDLHSGALSHGQHFVNFYKLPESSSILKSEDFMTYIVVKNKIQEAIAAQFGIKAKYLHLTYPTFFSRLTNHPPKTLHDEYWHQHVDKETYESFHYTSLIYLNDFKKEFSGGRFVFVNADNKTSIIEPKKGRVSIFTSGSENPHYVERVLNGVRYAITVSFTCDPTKAIPDLRPYS